MKAIIVCGESALVIDAKFDARRRVALVPTNDGKLTPVTELKEPYVFLGYVEATDREWSRAGHDDRLAHISTISPYLTNAVTNVEDVTWLP